MVQGWITYDNRLVSMENMTHQHMSNIYHFITKIVPQVYPNCVRDDVRTWLQKRFGGVVLPYHPVPEFIEEKTYLISKGYLQENNEIVVNNELIGCYE